MNEELKPAGLETPEGVKRVRKAMDVSAIATQDLCTVLVDVIAGPGQPHNRRERIIKWFKVRKYSTDFVVRVLDLYDKKTAAEEECVRAICNHPPAGR